MEVGQYLRMKDRCTLGKIDRLDTFCHRVKYWVKFLDDGEVTSYTEIELIGYFDVLEGLEAQAARLVDQDWTYTLEGNEKNGWVICVKELPGCMTEGQNFAHTISMVQDAMFGWILIALEDGLEIPKPEENQYQAG